MCGTNLDSSSRSFLSSRTKKLICFAVTVQMHGTHVYSSSNPKPTLCSYVLNLPKLCFLGNYTCQYDMLSLTHSTYTDPFFVRCCLIYSFFFLGKKYFPYLLKKIVTLTKTLRVKLIEIYNYFFNINLLLNFFLVY